MSDDDSARELKHQQALRESVEREGESESLNEAEAAAHRRRAEKAAYLQEKLAEREQAEEDTSDATPHPVLHHVTLKTNRVEQMVEWYGITVGMTTNHHSRYGAWMTNDGANHRVALLAHPALRDDPDKIPHTGMHHLAFEYADIGQLIDTYERLKGRDIAPHACLDHGMTTSLYYVDPDGNSVELQADNFGDWAASSQWMRTAPDFEVNPIGVSVDPELLLRAWRDGVDATELHRRSFAGEFDPGTPLDLRLPPETAPLA